MQDKVQNKKPNGSKWAPYIVAAIGAMLGSTGTVAIYLGTPFGQSIARPNPYTSIQAEAQHKQTNARLMNLEEHVKDHPDAELRRIISDIRAEMAAFEATQRVIIKNQDRILDKLN